MSSIWVHAIAPMHTAPTISYIAVKPTMPATQPYHTTPMATHLDRDMGRLYHPPPPWFFVGSIHPDPHIRNHGHPWPHLTWRSLWASYTVRNTHEPVSKPRQQPPARAFVGPPRIRRQRDTDPHERVQRAQLNRWAPAHGIVRRPNNSIHVKSYHRLMNTRDGDTAADGADQHPLSRGGRINPGSVRPSRLRASRTPVSYFPMDTMMVHANGLLERSAGRYGPCEHQ